MFKNVREDDVALAGCVGGVGCIFTFIMGSICFVLYLLYLVVSHFTK